MASITMQVFIDDSRRDGEVLILAGFVASTDDWEKFSVEWQKRLDETGILEFKMAERIRAPSEINGYFYRAIEDHVHGAVCCALPLKSFQKVASEFSLNPSINNAFLFSIKAIINWFAQMQSNFGIEDKVDFIFDEQTEVRNTLPKLWRGYVNSLPEETKRVTGQKPVFKDSARCKPLQAADLMAWWFRDRWEKEGTLASEKLPYPWLSKRDYPRLMIEFGEDDLRQELRKGYELAGTVTGVPLVVQFQS